MDRVHKAHKILKITAYSSLVFVHHKSQFSNAPQQEVEVLKRRLCKARELQVTEPQRKARGDQASKRRDKGSGDKIQPFAHTNIAASSWQGQEPQVKGGQKGKNGGRDAKRNGAAGKWNNHVMRSGSKFDDMVAQGQMHGRNLTSLCFLFQNHGKTLR